MPAEPDAMSSTSFHLIYDGPALRTHEMSARELSTALIAADSLFTEADRLLNGGRSETRLTVKASFESGCFGIHFSSAMHILTVARDFFAGPNARAILSAGNILKLIFGTSGLVALLKFLRRRRPHVVEAGPGRVRFIVGHEFFEAEEAVLELFNAHKIRQAIEDVITKPMEHQGIDEFAVEQDKAILVSVTRAQAVDMLATPQEPETLRDSTRETWVSIVSAAFKAGDKWRVDDGESTFFASITDPDFALAVLRSEVEFGASTQLLVSIHEVQFTDSKGVLHKESDIIRVLQVKKPVASLRLESGSEPKALPNS